MIDGFGRRINYLRLSVTDRCNLRCIYCSMCMDFHFLPHNEILTYEECSRIISLAGDLGLEKIRLTGGEPFVRKGFVDFVVSVLRKYPSLDIRITTNGTLITRGDIRRLKDAGIGSINVSLDTFDPDRFRWIAGVDMLNRVLSSLDMLLEEGIRTKVNVVSLKGINDGEIEKFVQFASSRTVDVRFIEFMDISGKSRWHRQFFISAREILRRIEDYCEIRPVCSLNQTSGPARMYEIVGGRGRIGVISPLSNHFCGTCNRVRITAEGRVKTCLFSPVSYRIKPLLRNPRFSDSHLCLVLKTLIQRKKPVGHEIFSPEMRRGEGMYSIGG